MNESVCAFTAVEIRPDTCNPSTTNREASKNDQSTEVEEREKRCLEKTLRRRTRWIEKEKDASHDAPHCSSTSTHSLKRDSIR